MYSILTDSLTLNGTGILDCYSDKKKSEWNDVLVNTFKKFRNFLLNHHRIEESSMNSNSSINEKPSTDNILDTCRLSIDILNDN